MAKYAVIKTGGKQYLVKDNDEIIVERLMGEEKTNIELEKLAEFDSDDLKLQLGEPLLKNKVTATILNQIKGDKIRVAKFRAKVRYRKVTGFRPKYTKLKITKV